MAQDDDTHSTTMGYILWIFGFMGVHRFYFGRPISATIYFFTLGELRDRLERGVFEVLEDIKVNGHPQARLANTSNMSFRAVEAEAVVLGLDLEGIAVGSGSACTSGAAEPSHVLLAMGVEPRLAAGAVRFSLGWGNTAAEVDRVLGVLPGIVGRLREMSVF